MSSGEKIDYAMVTVYGSDGDQSISRVISTALSDKDIKILTPQQP